MTRIDSTCRQLQYREQTVCVVTVVGDENGFVRRYVEKVIDNELMIMMKTKM